MFDLIKQGFVNIANVNTLVLDEADQMLDLGFIEDIKAVKRKLVKKHQTLFFSATINKKIKKLAFSQVKSSAIRIQISPEDTVSKNVSHSVMFVEMDDKRFFLERFVKDNPESKLIVFGRTRVRAERVVKAMKRVNIIAHAIHGDKEQDERTNVMEKFRAGEYSILIATDVSARGIDIPDVDVVINYDLPEKSENYVHRVGRTGRGTNKGIALSFCSKEEKDQLNDIETYLNQNIEIAKISKNEYKETIDFTEESNDVLDLINSHETWEKSKKSKKKKSKK